MLTADNMEIYLPTVCCQMLIFMYHALKNRTFFASELPSQAIFEINANKQKVFIIFHFLSISRSSSAFSLGYKHDL